MKPALAKVIKFTSSEVEHIGVISALKLDGSFTVTVSGEDYSGVTEGEIVCFYTEFRPRKKKDADS